MRIPIVLLALTVAPSCFVSRAHFNSPIPAEKVAALVPGETTAAEVVEILGAPLDVVELWERSAYLYLYSQTKRAGFTVIVLTMINDDRHWDRVWVFFDESGVLTHVGTTLEADRAEYKLPFQDHEQDEPAVEAVGPVEPERG